MDRGENIRAEILSALDNLPQKRKGEKRVTFAPDEHMVSDFVEHRETQRPGYSVTPEEVTSAYKQRCLKHQVKPKPKVLKQIEVKTVVSRLPDGRAVTPWHIWDNGLERETEMGAALRIIAAGENEAAAAGAQPRQLDLQGNCAESAEVLKSERLDYHSCESLEDILKLRQFEFINLRETQLEENGASSLLDMILYYESTTRLDISSNANIGIWGWRALSRLIQQSRCLRRLDAGSMPVPDDAARMLSGALLSSRLTVLSLENSCLSGRPLFTLVGTLKKNACLQELCLASNKLNSFQDSMQLGDLLKYNRRLQCLDLSNNLISDEGLREICEGLRARESNLRKLLLRGNRLTERGTVHLAAALDGIKRLETLNLGNNELGDRGVQTLKDSLIANRSLRHLCLASTQITCEGAVALAEFIAECRQIQQLDIRENLVGTGGLMALSLALKINRSLVRVDVDQKPEEDEEDFLIEMQRNLLDTISDRCHDNACGIKPASSQPDSLTSYNNPNPAPCEQSAAPKHVNSAHPAAPGQEKQPGHFGTVGTDTI